MKKRIAKKIYRRVYRSMMASFESFAFYHIKQCGNTWSVTIRLSTAPYSRAQYIKACNVLKKAYRIWRLGAQGTTRARRCYNKRYYF